MYYEVSVCVTNKKGHTAKDSKSFSSLIEAHAYLKDQAYNKLKVAVVMNYDLRSGILDINTGMREYHFSIKCVEV